MSAAPIVLSCWSPQITPFLFSIRFHRFDQSAAYYSVSCSIVTELLPATNLESNPQMYKSDIKQHPPSDFSITQGFQLVYRFSC